MDEQKQKQSKVIVISIIASIIALIVLVLVGVKFLGGDKKQDSNNNDGSNNVVQEQHIKDNEEKKEYNFQATSKEEKEQYKLSSEVVKGEGNSTIVKGQVKSDTNTTKTIQIVAKFYKDDNTLAIVSQTVVENLGAGETRNFEIEVQGNYVSNKYVLEVEYVE